MARIIAIVNQKGGVGKSTTACNLAACLATAKRQTLLIDLDAQSNATMTLGIDPRDIREKNVLHVLRNPSVVTDILIEVDEFLHLVPSHIDLASEEYLLINMMNAENQIRKAIKIVEDDYDYVLFDCPPNLGICTRNAIQAAYEIIIPFDPSPYSFDGLEKIRDYVASSEQDRGIKIVTYGMLCRAQLQRNVDKDALERLEELFGDHVLPTVRQNIKVVEASTKRTVIVWDDPSAIGARDYVSLTKAILQMEKVEEAKRPLRVVGDNDA